MKMFLLAAMFLPALSFASECEMTRNYTGSGTSIADTVYTKVSSFEECFESATREIGKTKMARVRKQRGGYRKVKVQVTSVSVKTVIDDVKLKGSVRRARTNKACQVKELVKFMGNDWIETDSEELSSCLEIAGSKLSDKKVKFRVTESDFLFKGKMKKLSSK